MLKTLTINGRQYVAGLKWAHFSDRNLASDRIAKRMAIQDGSNVYLRFQTDPSMEALGINRLYSIGTGYLEHKKRTRLYSIGVALAGMGRPDQTWSRIYQITEELYLYIAVLPGCVVDPGNYGEVLGSREEIARARAEQFAQGIEIELVEKTYEDLLEDLSRPHQPGRPLKFILPTPRWVIILRRQWYWFVGALIVLGLIFAWFRYQAYVNNENARKAAEAAAAFKTIYEVHQTFQYPDPKLFLRTCTELIEATQFRFNRWNAVEFNCNVSEHGAGKIKLIRTHDGRRAPLPYNPEGISIRLQRHWLGEAEALYANAPNGTVDTNRKTVLETLPPVIVRSSSDDNVSQSVQQVLKDMRDLAALADINDLSVTESSNTISFQGIYRLLSFHFQSKLNPQAIKLESIGGLRLLSLTYIPATESWRVEGVVFYVNH